MFANLLNSLKTSTQDIASSILSDKNIPISETAINSALAPLIKNISEIEAMSVEIQDGYFDVKAQVRKVLLIETITRFEIVSCEISSEKQVIIFRRLGKTDMTADNMIQKILIAVFKTIICRMMDIDPLAFALEGQAGFTTNGDQYTVDLSQTVLSAKVAEKAHGFLKIAGNFMKVKQLRCVPNGIEVVLGR